jgi:hypothetical protein
MGVQKNTGRRRPASPAARPRERGADARTGPEGRCGLAAALAGAAPRR